MPTRSAGVQYPVPASTGMSNFAAGNGTMLQRTIYLE